MFKTIQRVLFGTERRRVIYGMVGAVWFGGTLSMYPNLGWPALIVGPFLLGLTVMGAMGRSWWMIPTSTAAYILGAAVGALWWSDSTSLTYTALALATLMFVAGLIGSILYMRQRGGSEAS